MELKKRFSSTPVWPEPEIKEGWRDLVCDLVDALDATGVPYAIDQVKQKFAALRFYVETPDTHPRLDEFYALIRAAEERSTTVCERCGQAGQPRGGGFSRTLCADCMAKLS